jgi:hypothetical protein
LAKAHFWDAISLGNGLGAEALPHRFTEADLTFWVSAPVTSSSTAASRTPGWTFSPNGLGFFSTGLLVPCDLLRRGLVDLLAEARTFPEARRVVAGEGGFDARSGWLEGAAQLPGRESKNCPVWPIFYVETLV